MGRKADYGYGHGRGNVFRLERLPASFPDYPCSALDVHTAVSTSRVVSSTSSQVRMLVCSTERGGTMMMAAAEEARLLHLPHPRHPLRRLLPSRPLHRNNCRHGHSGDVSQSNCTNALAGADVPQSLAANPLHAPTPLAASPVPPPPRTGLFGKCLIASVEDLRR